MPSPALAAQPTESWSGFSTPLTARILSRLVPIDLLGKLLATIRYKQNKRHRICKECCFIKISLSTRYGEKKKKKKKKKNYIIQGAAAPLLQLVPAALLPVTAGAASGTTGGAGATVAGGTSEAEGAGAIPETARNSESERGNLGEF